jgi:DNA polymerase-4
VSNLDGDGSVQPELPFEPPRQDGLDAAVDRVRDRFGAQSLRRADMLGRELHPSVPILPD